MTLQLPNRVQGASNSAIAASVTVTLSNASQAGTLLLCTMDTGQPVVTSLPAGWSKLIQSLAVGSYTHEIWAYPSNPGGISSVLISGTGATFIAGIVTEWTGTANVIATTLLESSGSANNVTPGSSLALATAGSLTKGDLVVLSMTASSSTSAFAPGTNYIADPNNLNAWNLWQAHRLSAPGGIESQTVTWTGGSVNAGAIVGLLGRGNPTPSLQLNRAVSRATSF